LIIKTGHRSSVQSKKCPYKHPTQLKPNNAPRIPVSTTRQQLQQQSFQNHKSKEWAKSSPTLDNSKMEDGPQLTPVGEKSLPAKCKAGAVAYCPTMDLIALATEDEELRVFRLNGQRVFGGSFGGDPYLGEDEEDGEIRGMAWKGNGTCAFDLIQPSTPNFLKPCQHNSIHDHSSLWIC
jgi:hypothetical protein